MRFNEEVSSILDDIRDMLVSKNEKYGNSALEPIGVFSKLSPKEGLLIRIDDKLKRIKNGSLDKDDEDVVNDLIGYLVLLKIYAKSKYESISVQSNGEGGLGVPNTQPFPRWQEPHTYYPNVEIPCVNPNGTAPSPYFVTPSTPDITFSITPGVSIGTITTPNGMSTSTTHGYPLGSGWSYTSTKSHNED